MIYILQNFVPIAAATFAGLAFAALWYGLLGRSEAPTVRHYTTGLIVTDIIAEFWFASILAGALILAPDKANPWVMAIGSAVVIWIGFVVPVLVVTLRHRGEDGRTLALDVGHWLGVMVVQAVVLHAIGLTAPPAS
ncbi:DUF1761 domain-containing protein [Sphingosinicellaceae bacterium]|nr:DUF1761 domain-containing protein [Sphingosinicellaceae bacterium]